MNDTVIGAVRIVAGLDTAWFDEALTKASVKAKQGADRMKASFDSGLKGFGEGLRGELQGTVSQIPLLGDAVTGLGGVFGAAALGGLALFTAGLMKARESMDWAAELTDQANFIGVSAEALQEYRYIADEAGVSIQDMESGLKSLNVALGAMQTGVASKKTAKVFEALGITQADLKPMRDASELLPLVADRISKLGTQAQQAQIAEKLGIGPLLPVLQQGADAIKRLATESRNLGLIISNETVAALDDAQRKAEKASQVIDAQLTVAFANLAPIITGATEALAENTKGLADWLTKARQAAKLDGVYGAARIDAIRRGFRGKDADKYAQGSLMQSLELAASTEFVRNNQRPKSASASTPPAVASAMDKAGGAKAAKKSVEDYVAVLERLETADEKAMQQFVKDSLTLKKALDARKISLKQYEDAMARLGDFEAADPFAKVTKSAQDIEPVLRPGIEILTNEYEILAETIGTDLAYAFGDAIARGEDLGDAFADVVRRMVATWATSGLMKLFGINEAGGLSGGGLIGLLGLKTISSGDGLTDVNKDGTRGVSFGSILSGLPTLGGLGGVLSRLPGFAAGTLRAPGGLSWVGEEGPELMNVPRGAQVFPAHVSRALMAGGAPVEVRVSVDKSKYFDVAVEQVAAPLANDAAMNGAAGGAHIATTQSAKRARRTMPT